MAAELIAGGIGAAIGGIQAIIGAGQANRANEDLKKLFSQRKAFKTPAEIFEILNMQQFNAAEGFSDDTTSYLTGQAGAGLAAGLGTASRLGADPNNLSGIIDSYYADIFKIGAESDLVKMKKFDSLTSALQLVAQNKEAEQVSADNLIKDQMQAAAARLNAGQQNIQSGLNASINSLTTLAMSDLYKDKDGKDKDKTKLVKAAVSYTPTTAPTIAPLDFSLGNQRGNYKIGG